MRGYILAIAKAFTLIIFCINSSFALGEPFTEFSCAAATGEGHRGDLNWWNYTYSGYQWIDCYVESEKVKINKIKINNGNCTLVDDWVIDREFVKGDHIKISHSCMDPITIELSSNGKTSLVKIK